MTITNVTVEVEGKFEAEGLPPRSIVCRARLERDAGGEALAALVRYTDKAAEIQNFMRTGVFVTPID